jgi:hypothetical protein
LSVGEEVDEEEHVRDRTELLVAAAEELMHEVYCP